ncbi:MAG: glycosyltransferase [Pseudoxanthomonas suwonensis]|nr:glycosyltransferase [Pseudoxanthomonas suwonensis]
MHRRLTVLQLLPALESGGVERSTIEITQALVAAGHRALVMSAGGRLVPAIEAAGGEHLTLAIGHKSLRTLGHVPKLARRIRRESVDIVHARSRLPAWLGLWAIRCLPAAQRPRFMTTMHGLNSASRYSAVMGYGDRVICVSQTVHDYLLRHYPRTDPGKLRVIPRGLDPAAFPRRAHPDRQARARVAAAHPALAGDGPLLLLPGRGTRLKGHADAIDLLQALRADGSDVRLWMPGARESGREAYMDELQALARDRGVEAALAMTPPTAAIADAYAASDLVLQLSRKPEAFGRTVLEALAVGRPVLGWEHGGVGELLRRLQPDGAVPVFDAAALAAAAAGLLSRPPPPAATMPFTLQAMQDATLAVYDELVPR